MEKPYKLPDPKTNPVGVLVLAYKVTKGVPHDERAWDRVHWGRASKAAKDLLDICGGVRQADSCLVDVSRDFEEKGLSWTLETVVKHAHDWVARKRGATNADAQLHRARLFKALIDGRGSGAGEGQSTEDRSLHGSNGGVDASQEAAQANGAGNGSGDHGAVVDRLLSGQRY